jgi:hypothetical protein
MKLRFVGPMLVFLLRAACVCAQSDDGFGGAQKIEGDHFTIYYKAGVDPGSLSKQCRVSHSDEILSGQSVDASSDARQLSSMMEVLFARASDILDLHVYSYKGSIKVFSSLKELTDYYDTLYHTPVPGTGYAFYVDDDKSIYISSEYFRREVLGHEIGHAIMSGYFVVQPSVKIEEVLAGYIEYQLKKSE